MHKWVRRAGFSCCRRWRLLFPLQVLSFVLATDRVLFFVVIASSPSLQISSFSCLLVSSVPVLEFLGCLRINIAVVFLTTGHVLRIITLQCLHVEHVAERTAVWSGNSLDADVELPAVRRVSVSRVVPWLFHFCRVWADKSFCHFCSSGNRLKEYIIHDTLEWNEGRGRWKI